MSAVDVCRRVPGEVARRDGPRRRLVKTGATIRDITSQAPVAMGAGRSSSVCSLVRRITEGCLRAVPGLGSGVATNRDRIPPSHMRSRAKLHIVQRIGSVPDGPSRGFCETNCHDRRFRSPDPMKMVGGFSEEPIGRNRWPAIEMRSKIGTRVGDRDAITTPISRIVRNLSGWVIRRALAPDRVFPIGRGQRRAREGGPEEELDDLGEPDEGDVPEHPELLPAPGPVAIPEDRPQPPRAQVEGEFQPLHRQEQLPGRRAFWART